MGDNLDSTCKMTLSELSLAHDSEINNPLMLVFWLFEQKVDIQMFLMTFVYSKTRPVLSRSIMSILSHAADSSAVLGVYTAKLNEIPDRLCDYTSPASPPRFMSA